MTLSTQTRSEYFQKVSEALRKVQILSEMLRNYQEFSDTHRNSQKRSNTFRNTPKLFRNVQILAETFRNSRKHSNTFRNTQKHSETLGNIQILSETQRQYGYATYIVMRSRLSNMCHYYYCYCYCIMSLGKELKYSIYGLCPGVSRYCNHICETQVRPGEILPVPSRLTCTLRYTEAQVVSFCN